MRLLALSVMVVSVAAWPCAPAPPEGRYVTIDTELALITYDAATHREHFIRRAAFTSDADDFGFLVPTPTKPTLREVSGDFFKALERATKPEVVHGYALGSMLLLSARKSAPPLPGSRGVEILEQTTVAGLDATVLTADDPASLAAWLAEHGYPLRPSLEAWLAPYVENHWVLTAFKLSKTPATPGVSSPLVDLEFTTERPMYPYREPVEKTRASRRTLRVYFVGPWRAQGTAPFAAKTYWAKPFDPKAAELPVTAPANAWLSVFDDTANPRPATDDVWFERAADQGEVAPPAIHDDTEVPCELACPVAVIVLIAVSLGRRRATPKPSSEAPRS